MKKRYFKCAIVIKNAVYKRRNRKNLPAPMWTPRLSCHWCQWFAGAAQWRWAASFQTDREKTTFIFVFSSKPSFWLNGEMQTTAAQRVYISPSVVSFFLDLFPLLMWEMLSSYLLKRDKLKFSKSRNALPCILGRQRWLLFPSLDGPMHNSPCTNLNFKKMFMSSTFCFKGTLLKSWAKLNWKSTSLKHIA